MSCNVIKVTKLESKIVTLEVPKIDVKRYPIYAIDDTVIFLLEQQSTARN